MESEWEKSKFGQNVSCFVHPPLPLLSLDMRNHGKVMKQLHCSTIYHYIKKLITGFSCYYMCYFSSSYLFSHKIISFGGSFSLFIRKISILCVSWVYKPIYLFVVYNFWSMKYYAATLEQLHFIPYFAISSFMLSCPFLVPVSQFLTYNSLSNHITSLLIPELP